MAGEIAGLVWLRSMIAQFQRRMAIAAAAEPNQILSALNPLSNAGLLRPALVEDERRRNHTEGGQ